MTGAQGVVDRIGFVLNGRPVAIPTDIPAATTLLDWLRGPAGLTGTKEGCDEGDCGACTVVLEDPDGTRTPINACLAMLGQIHGRAVRTVEGLAAPNGAPHPVQDLLARADATQCGFCTPGIVMSAWAHARQGGDVHEALAGNLCRCTGYRPILDAFAALENDAAPPPEEVRVAAGRFISGGHEFHLPRTMAELLALRAARPEALLLAGGTDLGLLLGEGRCPPPAVICVVGVPELQRIDPGPDELTLGAAASYERLLRHLEREPGGGLASLAPLLRRVGSRQIRGLGTVGGNLGTGSPIGDMLPPLLALGASVQLRSARGSRTMLVEDFLLGYRRTALAADEVIEAVRIPHPPEGALCVCEKVSKRYDQDIATVGAAMLLAFDGDRVRTARLAFGGMGPTAARARHAEAVLEGAVWSAAAIERAASALDADFAPISDLRGSAEYRRIVAGNLLRRLWWRHAVPGLPVEVQAL